MGSLTKAHRYIHKANATQWGGQSPYEIVLNFLSAFNEPLLRFLLLQFFSYACVSVGMGNILSTLVYRIDVHACLLILRQKSPLHGLILVCTFIDFEKKFPLHVYSGRIKIWNNAIQVKNCFGTLEYLKKSYIISTFMSNYSFSL